MLMNCLANFGIWTLEYGILRFPCHHPAFPCRCCLPVPHVYQRSLWPVRPERLGPCDTGAVCMDDYGIPGIFCHCMAGDCECGKGGNVRHAVSFDVGSALCVSRLDIPVSAFVTSKTVSYR